MDTTFHITPYLYMFMYCCQLNNILLGVVNTSELTSCFTSSADTDFVKGNIYIYICMIPIVMVQLEKNQEEGTGLLRSMTTHLERKNDGAGGDERKRRQCRHR